MFQARHGDLWIESTKSIPKNAKPKKDAILAYGEATGHCHKVETENFDDVDLFVDPNGNIYVEIKKDKEATLVHDEHGPITLTGPGIFEVTRQREYDAAAADEERRVLD